jgi:hypothetical protein
MIDLVDLHKHINLSKYVIAISVYLRQILLLYTYCYFKNIEIKLGGYMYF